MINISGKLVVRTSVERNGQTLKEGLLKCSLGRFRVKYFNLETLSLGEHEGFFTMSKIEPYYHSQQGKFCIELEAAIEKMAFISQPNALSVEQAKTPVQLSFFSEGNEPVKEKPEIAKTETATSENPVTTKRTYILDIPESHHRDNYRDDILPPLASIMKLDASEDREVLRQQAFRLQQLGYKFDERNQHWFLSENEQAVH